MRKAGRNIQVGTAKKSAGPQAKRKPVAPQAKTQTAPKGGALEDVEAKLAVPANDETKSTPELASPICSNHGLRFALILILFALLTMLILGTYLEISFLRIICLNCESPADFFAKSRAGSLPSAEITVPAVLDTKSETRSKRRVFPAAVKGGPLPYTRTETCLAHQQPQYVQGNWQVAPDCFGNVPREKRVLNDPIKEGTESVPWQEAESTWPVWAQPIEAVRKLLFVPSNAFGYGNLGEENEEWESTVHANAHPDNLYSVITNACIIPYRHHYVVVFRRLKTVYLYDMPANSANCPFWEAGICAREYLQVDVSYLSVHEQLPRLARRVPGVTSLLSANKGSYNFYHDWVNWFETAMAFLALNYQEPRAKYPTEMPASSFAVSLTECYRNRSTLEQRAWIVRNDYYDIQAAKMRATQGVPSLMLTQILRELLPSNIPIILPECELRPFEIESMCFDKLMVPSRKEGLLSEASGKKMDLVIKPFRDISFRMFGIAPPKSFCDRVFGTKVMKVSVYGRETEFRNLTNTEQVVSWLETSSEIRALFPGIRIEVRRLPAMTGPRKDAHIWVDTDVMISPHGAAHVNSIYMPENAVLIDINPGCLRSTNKTASPGAMSFGSLHIRTWGAYMCIPELVHHNGSISDHMNCNWLRPLGKPCSFALPYDDLFFLMKRMSDKLYETAQNKLERDAVVHGCSSAWVDCSKFYDLWCPSRS